MHCRSEVGYYGFIKRLQVAELELTRLPLAKEETQELFEMYQESIKGKKTDTVSFIWI